jgi:capsular polysaccharide biosynthesis protein
MQFINPSQPPAADPDALLPPIELREYLFVVFRHWRVVAVMVFVAALVSAGAGVFGAKTYSAVATIAVTDTRIQPQQVLAAAVSDKTLTELALTDKFNHMRHPMQGLTAADLRSHVQVTSKDNVVFSIAARDSSAAGAALLANTLAELLVRQFAVAAFTAPQLAELKAAGIDLQAMGSSTPKFSQTQLEALRVQLTEELPAHWDAQLVKLERELGVKGGTYADITASRALANRLALLPELLELRKRLARRGTESVTPFGEALQVLGLAGQILVSRAPDNSYPPVVSINAGGFEGVRTGTLLDAIDSVVAAMAAKYDQNAPSGQQANALMAIKGSLDTQIAIYDMSADMSARLRAVLPHGVAPVPDTWMEPNLRTNVLAATGAALALSLMLIFGYEYVWGGGLPGSRFGPPPPVAD